MPYKNIEERKANTVKSNKIRSENCYFKRYYQEHKEKYRQNLMREDKEKRKIRIKRYLKNNIELRKKYNARMLARHKISLKDKSCVKCGSKESLHRHHEDYNKPLEVMILCEVCHRNIHGQLSYPRGNDWGVTNVSF